MRLMLPIAALAAVPVLAHAQIVSAYATFAPSHVSGVINGNASSGGYNSTSYWTPAAGGGVTLNVLPVGPVRIGLDLRASGSAGSNSDTLVLFGPRVAVRLPIVKLKPYVQASGGYLRTNTTLVASPFAGSSATNGFGAWEVLGGIDRPVLPFFDLRVIEVGGGKAYNISGAGVPSGYTVSLFTLSSGLVFHF
jgi:hypothetical protein